jgi:glycosyltransferase involved in cell wall biosynthesis
MATRSETMHAAPAAARQRRLRTLAIVPALNEAEQIAKVIAELRAVEPDVEVVVVDDGSTDATAAEARRAGAHVIRLPFNLGIGGAVQTGFKYAVEHGFEIAFQLDADGQHDPGELDALIAPVARGEADIVIGSRFLGLGQYAAPRGRRLAMALFARVVSIIVRQPLSDTSSSFRAMNRRALRLFAHEYPHGYLETVEATVMASKYGLRLKEVPVHMRQRMFGRSSLTIPLASFYAFKVIVAMFISLFRRRDFHLEENP